MAKKTEQKEPATMLQYHAVDLCHSFTHQSESGFVIGSTGGKFL